MLDSSVSLAWFFDDEASEAADAVLDSVRDDGAVVPPLWYFEVANGLQIAVRRKRIDGALRERALGRLEQLVIAADAESIGHAWHESVRLAGRHGLTVYDAAYLELAQRRRLSLATLDRALVRAAGVEGVRTIGHSEGELGGENE